MQIDHPYRRRNIRPLQLWTAGDWRLKLYGISLGPEGPAAELVDAARDLALKVLPRPAVTPTRYGVGFMGVHQGRGASMVFVDWWERQNELHHHAWRSEGAASTQFEYVSPLGLAACVWDLAVMAFEREAWVAGVLLPSRPDIQQYLGSALAGEV
jgi:hypothetical protein